MKQEQLIIAITGASGHLGGVLIDQLLNSTGYKIRGQYNTHCPERRHDQLEWVKGDLSEESLKELFEGADIVVHAAALISIDGDLKNRVFEVNVQGTKDSLAQAQKSGVNRFIHVSSTHALQEVPLNSVFDESRPYKSAADFAYDYSKALAEQAVLETVRKGYNAVIVRPSAMIGPPDYRPSLLGKAVSDFAKGKIPMVVHGGYDIVDVRDVAQSIIRSFTDGEPGDSFNLTGRYCSMLELAQISAQFGGSKAPKLVAPNWLIQCVIPFAKLYAKVANQAPRFTRESIHTLKNGHPDMASHKAERILGHASRPLELSIHDLLKQGKNDF